MLREGDRSDEGEASVKSVPAMLSVLKLRWNIKSGGRDCLFGMWVQMRKTGLDATVALENKLRLYQTAANRKLMKNGTKRIMALLKGSA